MTKTVKDLIEKPVAKKPSLLVDSGKLASALGRIASVVTSNPIVPILDNVLMTAEEGRLTCRVSDLQVDAQVSLEVSCNTPFQCAVPVKLLLELLKSLPAQEVWFRYEPDTFTLTLEVLSGSYQLPGENPVDFPKLSQVLVAAQQMDAGLLALALQQVGFAVGRDDLRPQMTGVLICAFPEGTEFCATDGHRLATFTTEHQSNGPSMLIPGKLVRLLQKLLPKEGTVSFSTNNAQVRFEWSEMRLQARLIDERYPDYKNAIPNDQPITALLDRKALIKIINRVSLFAGSRHELAFAFQADGSLSISAFDLDYNKQCKENYECREYKGDPITIGFDGRMLAEGLSVLQSDEVFFNLSGHNRAMTIEPVEESEGGKILQLLMPVMLNNNNYA